MGFDFDFKFEPKNFNFSSLDFSPQGGKADGTGIPKLSLEPVMYDNALTMAQAIDYGNQDYFAIVAGSFIFGDLIEALCDVHDLKPKAVYLTTLGMGSNNVDSIVNLVDYLGCEKVNLIVSHYFWGTEQGDKHNLVFYMAKEFKGRPIDVAVLQSHMKIALILSDKGNVLLAGSANLSSSNNVEQFVLLHSPPHN